jgi:AraC-like DNA-binding protein
MGYNNGTLHEAVVYTRSAQDVPHAGKCAPNRFVVSDRDFNLHSGHGLFIPPDVRHTWKAVAQGALLGVLLEVKGEEREVFLARAEDAMTRGKGLLLSRDAGSLIRDVCCRLSARSIELGGIDEIAALLDLFHIELIRAQFGLLRWQPMASGSGMATDAVQRAMQLAEGAMRFIESNYMHPVRLRDIALHVGVSERHVNRVFQERYKATINKTLLRVRLERAFRMLSEHQEYSITAIAHDTGFSSAAYFARCFKQAYGMSPLKAQGR